MVNIEQIINRKVLSDFNKDGAVLLKNIFKDWVDDIKVGIEKLMNNPSPRERSYKPKDGTAPFFQDLNNWNRIQEFKSFIYNSNSGVIAARLMNSKTARFFHDHVLVKEPGSSIVTPWHQDQPYYCIKALQSVSFWIPLDKIEISTSLKCVAGSHLWGKLHKPKRFNGEDLFENDNSEEMPNIDDNILNYRILSWEMEPGDAIAFNFRIIHGANANNNLNSRRRVFSARWVGDDARYVDLKGKGSPPFENINLKTGDKLDTPDFPVIYNS